MLSVLAASVPKQVRVNEPTTGSLAFAMARFINGKTISGNPRALNIATGNTPNLVDPVTGYHDLTVAG